MAPNVETRPGERRLGSVDLFCMETYQPARGTAAKASPRSRWLPYVASAICLLLTGLALVLWWSYSLEQDREALLQQLANERAARLEAQLSVKDIELRLASYALETRVRRDLVDGRMSEQERRAVELEEEAAKVRLAKLVEADCVTPRSVFAAVGL